MLKPTEYLLDHPEKLAHLPPLYATEKQEIEEHILAMRFYHPLSRTNWYAVEYDLGEKIIFGWVDGPCPEWGYSSLLEMAFTKVRGVPVMWDEDFKPVCFLDLPREDDGG